MSDIIKEEIAIQIETCCVCGTKFGVDKNILINAKQHGNGFFCPNGHRMIYTDNIKKEFEENKNTIKEQKEQIKFLETQNRQLKCDILKHNIALDQLRNALKSSSIFAIIKERFGKNKNDNIGS